VSRQIVYLPRTFGWWQRIDEWVGQNRPASETVRPAG
jgi:hypothetical protein